MQSESKKAWYPLLAAMLTLSLSSVVAAEPPPVIARESSSLAFGDELELLKEEETVSIASRYEQPISQAPSNVYVITDEDIRHSGATDIPTILRRVPGLEVMQTTGADFNVSVRGDNQFRANKLLVMVDGRSIYLDAQGNVFWKNLPVTLPEIKRIEGLKGPASAIYGFNAFDGVIHINTQSPEEMKGTTLQFGGGEVGTISSAAVHAGSSGKVGYRLSVGHDQNQQWRSRDSLAFRNNKVNAHTEYALGGDAKLLFSGGLVDSNRYDGDLGDVGISSTRPTQGYANVAYERPTGFVRAWWQGNNTDSFVHLDPQLANLLRITNRNNSSLFTTTTNTYNIEAQHTLQLAERNHLTYGINYRQNTVSSDFIANGQHQNRLGLYLNDDWRLTDSLSLTAGTRLDLDSFIHAQLSPRFAVVYRPVPNHTIRAGLSIAYLPPMLLETYLDLVNYLTIPPPLGPATVTSPSLGSTTLNPEQIVSYDISYQGWFLRHRLRARADLFFNHISNLISFLSAGPSPSDPVRAANGGVADIYGGEVGIEYLATRWLSGFANYAYEHIGQTFSGTTTRGAPRSKFNLGIRMEWENGLNAETTFHHVGSASYPIGAAFSSLAPIGGFLPPTSVVGSYNLLNLRVGYRFWQQKAAAGYMRDAEVAFSIFNALNDKHREHPLGDRIGSRSMGWVTVRF